MILTALKGINLGLAFLLELGVLAALGYWGFTDGPNTFLKFVLGLGAPALAIVIWAIFGAPKTLDAVAGRRLSRVTGGLFWRWRAGARGRGPAWPGVSPSR